MSLIIESSSDRFISNESFETGFGCFFATEEVVERESGEREFLGDSRDLEAVPTVGVFVVGVSELGDVTGGLDTEPGDVLLFGLGAITSSSGGGDLRGAMNSHLAAGKGGGDLTPGLGATGGLDGDNGGDLTPGFGATGGFDGDIGGDLAPGLGATGGLLDGGDVGLVVSECDEGFLDNRGGGLEATLGGVAVVEKERGDFCLDEGAPDTAPLEVNRGVFKECNGSPAPKEEVPELSVSPALDGFSEVSDAGGMRDDGLGGSNGGGPLGSLGRALTLSVLIPVFSSSSSSSESVQ